MIINSKFSPRWWLRNPHLQTIVASKLVSRPSVASIPERIELNDGDFLDINWSKKDNGPLVCIFHGLAGSIESAYIKALFRQLELTGMRPVLMHWRGCSGEPNRLARSYHSGATDDIDRMVELIRQRFPAVPVYAVGYSLGANALLKYAGEKKTKCQLSGIVSICPPLVLSVGADKLNTGITRAYQRYLLKQMSAQHERKRHRYPELGLTAATPSLNNFWKFDDALTAPLHGFENVHDYYTKCSARQFLGQITTTTHIIYALDDPFFTAEVLPHKSELSEQVTLELSRHGGHVGFVGDKTDQNWLSTRISQLLSSYEAVTSSN